MGCDIQFHTEIKVNGQWLHYSQPRIERNYALFHLLAGVRSYNDGSLCISQPKGLPFDATITTRFCYQHDGNDAHSASYLTSGDIKRFYEAVEPEKIVGRHNIEWAGSRYGTEFKDRGLGIGYLFGNTWQSDYKESWPEGLEDFRWIFWFDN